MDRIIIDRNHLEKVGLTMAEFAYMVASFGTTSIQELHENLVSKGYIGGKYEGGKPVSIFLTEEGNALFNEGLLVPEASDYSEDTLLEFAESLKELYPKGKKIGNTVWAEGPRLIVRRLRTFFKKYGNNYTLEQIKEATKIYIESFNGSYTYMQTLKYFIFKEPVGKGGDVEPQSQLYNILEDPESFKNNTLNNEEWLSEMLIK